MYPTTPIHDTRPDRAEAHRLLAMLTDAQIIDLLPVLAKHAGDQTAYIKRHPQPQAPGHGRTWSPRVVKFTSTPA